MTSAALDSATDRSVAPFASRAVASLAIIVVVIHCAAVTFSNGYWFDEVYMLAIGRYFLEWGAADQPPVTPALVRHGALCRT